MYGDILLDELDHDWHCQILRRSFYTDSSKKKKKIFDSKKRFWKIIESFSSGFISDFLSN